MMSSSGSRDRRQSADPHHGVPEWNRSFQHSQRVQGNARRLAAWIHPGRDCHRKSEYLLTNPPVCFVLLLSDCVCEFWLYFLSQSLCVSMLLHVFHCCCCGEVVGCFNLQLPAVDCRHVATAQLFRNFPNPTSSLCLPCDWLAAAEIGSS